MSDQLSWKDHALPQCMSNTYRACQVAGTGQQFRCESELLSCCLLFRERRSVGNQLTVTIDEVDPVTPAPLQTVVVLFAFKSDVTDKQLFFAKLAIETWNVCGPEDFGGQWKRVSSPDNLAPVVAPLVVRADGERKTFKAGCGFVDVPHIIS